MVKILYYIFIWVKCTNVEEQLLSWKKYFTFYLAEPVKILGVSW